MRMEKCFTGFAIGRMIQAGGAQWVKDRLRNRPGAALGKSESQPCGRTVCKGGRRGTASNYVLKVVGGVGTRERRNRTWNGQPWRRMQRSDYKEVLCVAKIQTTMLNTWNYYKTVKSTYIEFCFQRAQLPRPMRGEFMQGSNVIGLSLRKICLNNSKSSSWLGKCIWCQ